MRCVLSPVSEVPAHQGEGNSLEGDGSLVFRKFPLEIWELKPQSLWIFLYPLVTVSQQTLLCGVSAYAALETSQPPDEVTR